VIILVKNIVEARNVNLKYRFIKNIDFRSSFFNFLKRGKKNDREKVVNALSDLTFNIRKGSTVGIIGENGAGKSTLLRLIAKIFEPDSGELILNTDSVSLLTLGTGFNKELSGIDNIYLNAILLGLKKSDVDEKLEEIIEFSELGEFVYAPIRTYSSGMRTKLAFSIAAHIEPELLLIDEVFSVGDVRFRTKSENKIRELINEDRTVVMVSHSLGLIEELCDEVIWISKGKLKGIGKASEMVKQYKEFMK
jgi:teichoic acid transport system ATP-binding protein